MYTIIRKCARFILAFAFLSPLSPAQAVSIAIDGDLKDWIGQPQGQASDWNPLRASTYASIEDQGGNANTYLNPGYGGQEYDAEAMYLEIDNGNLYIAIVTGLSPSKSEWPAGDIAIDFGNDGSFEYGIVTLGDSTNNRGGAGDAGEVYEVSEWNYGIWTNPDEYNTSGDSPYKRAHPTTIRSGTQIGTASLVYQEASYNGSVPPLGDLGGDHYVIEAAVSLDLFDDTLLKKDFTVHWTMACANDWIQTDPARVPEPPVILLLALGLSCLTAGGWKRQRAG